MVAAAQARPVGEKRTHEVRAATRTLIPRTSAYVSIRQRTSADVSGRQHVCVCIAFARRTLRAPSSPAVSSSAFVRSSLN